MAVVAIAALVVLCVSFMGIQSIHVLSNAALCGAYLLMFAILSTANDLKGKQRSILRYASAFGIIALAITETGVSAYKSVNDRKAWQPGIHGQGYPDNYAAINALLAPRDAHPNFYRAEFLQTDKGIYTRHNNPASFGYNGLSIYSSTINAAQARFYEAVGLPVFHAPIYEFSSYGYDITSPLSAMFLNLRYVINDVPTLADDGVFWERKADAAGFSLFENRYHLPLGFMTSGDIERFTLDSKNPFITQNNLFSAATGLRGDLFTLIDPADISGAYGYIMPASGTLYIYSDADKSVILIDTHANGVPDWLSNEYAHIIPAGFLSVGEWVSVYPQATEGTEPVLYAAVMDEGLFKQGRAALADETLNLTAFKDTYIKGEITAFKDGVLYTSIPALATNYWSAYVDGKKTDILPIGGAMAGVKLSAGEHIIEFRYVNRAFIAGVVISLVLVGAFIMMGRRRANPGRPVL